MMEESSFLHPEKVLRAARVHEGMHVADFAAGAGFFTRAAARLVGPEGVVWAVDAHQAMLPRLKSLAAAEGLHNVEVVHGNVEMHGGSKLPPQSFDFVIIVNVLFAAEDKQGVAAEARRILKRHGCALVIDWQDSFGGLGPHPSHVVSQHAAKKLFEEAGFTLVEPVPAGAYHWGFIVRKNAPKSAQ